MHVHRSRLTLCHPVTIDQTAIFFNYKPQWGTLRGLFWLIYLRFYVADSLRSQPIAVAVCP